MKSPVRPECFVRPQTETLGSPTNSFMVDPSDVGADSESSQSSGAEVVIVERAVGNRTA